MLEAAYMGAYAARLPTLGGPGGLARFLDPPPPARVLEGVEAAEAARQHAELAQMFDSLAASQQRARGA